MNQVIASNIRLFRERRTWTQEHLAAVAGINSRTVQRVEKGAGAQPETLRAIAAAFDVDVQTLRLDAHTHRARHIGLAHDKLTPELVAGQHTELDAKYTQVPMMQVATSADFRSVSGAMSCHFDCTLKDDSIQDLAAALQQDLTDLIDVGRDIDARQRRELEVGVFEHVKELEGHGAAVTIGLRRHYMKLANRDPIPWLSLYVVVSALDEMKLLVAVEKNQHVSFR